MSKTMESISGCLRVALTVMGGMTVTLAPVCATNLEPKDYPDGVLCDVRGIPFITSDGKYLIVAQPPDYPDGALLTSDNTPLITKDDLYLIINNN